MTSNTILFADIAGSTALYERLGDAIAESIINDTLGKLSSIVDQQKGEVIKTIGDEIMCKFESAEDAIQAANLMHEYTQRTTVEALGDKVAVRIGAHEGEIIETEGDVFGDTVNVSARIAALAQPGKTMISGETYESLPGYLMQFCRHVMEKQLKGKSQPVDIYDVVWEENEENTRVMAIPRIKTFKGKLTLTYGEQKTSISSGHLLIGRGKQCDFVVAAPQSSRHHCEVRQTIGGFTLTDNSTNGLYLKQNGSETFLHHDSAQLNQQGTISLGEPAASGDDHLIHFSIETEQQN